MHQGGKFMPLIEVTQNRYVSATIQLESETASLIDQYAAFVRGSADDVVDKALNYVFAKDREFQEYLKSPRSAKSGAVPACAQSRDWRFSGACQQWQAIRRRGGDTSRACSESVRGARRCPFGAAHRLNLDTPPQSG
jgi:hypothetical protein